MANQSKVLINGNKKRIALLVTVFPLLLQSLFKKRGGYLYRQAVSYVLIAIAASYGVLSAPLFLLTGKRGQINYSVSRVAGFLTKHLLGITATIEGEEYLDRKENQLAVYVCNHQTVLDILFLGFFFPQKTSMVAKKTLQYYPFLGWFMTLSKSIFLDRGNRESAVKQAKKAAQDIHDKKQSVFIFPEGTRNDSGTNTLLPFKKGAFYMATQAQVPIIPIVVSNYKDIYSFKEKRFSSGTLKIKVLPPVPTKDIPETSEAINELTNKIRNQMLVALNEISPI